jgi:hypothetical protein
MKSNGGSSVVAAFACTVCLFFSPATHAADTVREAAIGLADGWWEILTELAWHGLSDSSAFTEAKAKWVEPHLKVIRERGSKDLRREAEQLDSHIQYLASAIHKNEAEWKKKIETSGGALDKPLPPDGKFPPRPPITFPDDTLNALLGIDKHEDDRSKIAAAAGRAVVRFVKAAGISDARFELLEKASAPLPEPEKQGRQSDLSQP